MVVTNLAPLTFLGIFSSKVFEKCKLGDRILRRNPRALLHVWTLPFPALEMRAN